LLGIVVSVIVKSIAKDVKLITELNNRRKITFIEEDFEVKFIELKTICVIELRILKDTKKIPSSTQK
jgi:hypothetical protein